MAVTVLPGPIGPIDAKTPPAPFFLNAGTYKVSVLATNLSPVGNELVDFQYDASSIGTSGARGRWQSALVVTSNAGLQTLTVPTGGWTVRLVPTGTVLVTITS